MKFSPLPAISLAAAVVCLCSTARAQSLAEKPVTENGALLTLTTAQSEPATAAEKNDGQAGKETPATPRASLVMKASRVGSDSLFPFLALTELGLATSDDYGGRRAGRGALAIVTTGLATELLKRATKERRPNGEDDKSFPSGHASLSFAAATLLDAYRPGWKGAGYATATWISVSRVPLKAHYWHDVAAGALLGHLITREFTGKYRGDGRSLGGGGIAAVPAASLQNLALGMTPMAGTPDGKWSLGLGTRSVGLSRAF